MRKFNKDKLFTILLWIIIGASAVAMVVFLIWNAVYRVENKKLSIINYYNFPVEVSFLNYKDNFEPFEVKTFDIAIKDPFNVVTKKQEGTELSNIVISGLKIPEQLIQVVLSNTKDYCYFNANVTNIYNSNSDLITQVNLLNKTPLDYFVFGISEYTFNVYPGSNKPTEDDIKYKGIKGYYPIRCVLASEIKEIEKIVKTFIDYNHLEQLEYLNLKKVEIEQVQDIETLNNI